MSVDLDGTRWVGKANTKAEGITLDLFENIPFIYQAIIVNNHTNEVYGYIVRGVNTQVFQYKFDQVCTETGKVLK